MKRIAHRLLRSAGLHVERHRDAFADLARACPDARLVIDGGAFTGGASRAFLSLFPRAVVHAFEPTRDLSMRMMQEIDSDRFEVHQTALGDTVGFTQFHVTPEGFTSSLLDPGLAFGYARVIEVPVTTLDAFGRQPDVLKLDLQGGELAALRGAAKILPGVKAVLCEVNFVARYKGCPLAHEVTAFLYAFGLHFHRFYEVHTDRSGRWQFADALYVRH